MLGHFLKSATEFGFLGGSALLIFFAVFVGIVFWAFGMDKSKVSYLARLPLEEDKNFSGNKDKA